MKLMITCAVLFFCVLSLHGEKVTEFQDVINPKGIIVHNNNLVVIQNYEIPVHVYSLDTYKLKHKLGKRGDGPGEVRRTPLVFIGDDSYILFSRGKLLRYDGKGNLSAEEKVNHQYLSIKPVGDNFLATRDVFDPRDFSHTLKFFIMNKQSVLKREFHQGDRDVNSARGNNFNQFRMVTHYLDAQTYKNKIFIGDSSRGFRFDVFSENGNLLYTINRDFDKIRITEDYKGKLIDEFKARESELWPLVKDVMKFYKHFPPIRSFFVDDDRIYVTTYKQSGNKQELIVLDLKGNPVKRMFINSRSWQMRKFYGMRVDLFTIKNNRLYELVDNEENETYELHVTKLGGLK